VVCPAHVRVRVCWFLRMRISRAHSCMRTDTAWGVRNAARRWRANLVRVVHIYMHPCLSCAHHQPECLRRGPDCTYKLPNLHSRSSDAPPCSALNCTAWANLVPLMWC
jgi:hypothetical protein